MISFAEDAEHHNVDVASIKRVAVIGTSCCGKSTFARSLSEILGIKHIALDAEFWEPNWQKPPIDEFRPKVESMVAGDEWIIDGNYYIVQSLVFEQATHIIWLDFSFLRILYRGFDRTIRRIVAKEELHNGNRETFRGSFLSRNSILLWIFQSFPKNKKQYGQMFEENSPGDPEFLRLSKPGQAERFLKRLQATA